jgi:AraC-like DNA-binding protein
MVRASSLRGFRELVSDLGGQPVRLLRKAGIEPGALDQLAAFISFASLIDLLERSASDLDCPDFGLRLAERQDIGMLGTLAVAIRHSATVGDAIRCAARYISVHNDAVAFNVDAEAVRGHARLEFRVLVKHAPRWAQTAEHAVDLAWRILILLSERRCHLTEVRFPHPPIAPLETYHSRFDAPVMFHATEPSLTLSAKDLDLVISEHNQDLHDLATRYLDSALPRTKAPFTLQVRQTIEALLGTGACAQQEVAKALYMHPRTLQRRLREEGTSFEEIKDQTRRDLAERYLSHPGVPLAQVTALLDYSEQSALGRSCRRWFHASPREFRNRFSPSGPVPLMA